MGDWNMTTQFDRPLVSVITIFLNGERFIREAIESILAQTMDRWELLLVDDGSTDRSTEIALWYENECPEKIKYLEHEGHRNLGMSASRNLGIAVAQGKYIAFVDADDVWLPGRLERHLKVFEMFPSAVMVCSPTLYWFNWQPGTNEWAGKKDFVGDLFLPTGALLVSTVSLMRFLESVRKHQAGLQSFRSMRRIEASRRNASALRLRFSQSLASLRQRLSQAKVRSTTQRRGSTTNPLVRSERLTISVSSCGKIFAKAF